MGLRAGDLEDLVSNTISIDEFESKIDNEKAIVVAFKVADKEPAQDLSRFIEKSAVDLLDTEVSPAPDTDGKFVVFVEYSRNEKFPGEFITTVKSLKNLTNIGIDDFKFTVYKHSGTHNITEENLIEKVNLNSDNAKVVEQFFKDSVADAIILDENIVTLNKFNSSISFKIVDVNKTNILFDKYKLNGIPFKLNEEAKQVSRDMLNILGSSYSANLIKGYVLLSKSNSNISVLGISI